MNFPMDEKLRERFRDYVRSRGPEDSFNTVFIAAIKSELQRKDEENRNIGFENKQSAAHWIAALLRTVAACQAPVTDRNKQAEGEESESAQPIM